MVEEEGKFKKNRKIAETFLNKKTYNYSFDLSNNFKRLDSIVIKKKYDENLLYFHQNLLYFHHFPNII